MTSKNSYTKAHERALIKAARQGEQKAWDELVNHHWDKIEYLAHDVVTHKLGRNDLATTEDLRQEGLIRFLDIIERKYDFEKGEGHWLWTYAEQTLKPYLKRFLNKLFRPTERPFDVRGASDMAVSGGPEHILWASNLDALSYHLGIQRTSPFDDVQRRIHDCLQDTVAANKWVVLAILRFGLKKSWQVVTDNLQNTQADLSAVRSDGLSTWAWVHAVYDLHWCIPKQWDGVCHFFKKGKNKGARAVPKVNVVNLRRWYSNLLKSLHACYPGGVAPFA